MAMCKVHTMPKIKEKAAFDTTNMTKQEKRQKSLAGAAESH